MCVQLHNPHTQVHLISETQILVVGLQVCLGSLHELQIQMHGKSKLNNCVVMSYHVLCDINACTSTSTSRLMAYIMHWKAYHPTDPAEVMLVGKVQVAIAIS